MPYHHLQNFGLALITLLMMLIGLLTFQYGAFTDDFMHEVNEKHVADLRTFRKLSDQVHELDRLFSIDRRTELVSLDQVLGALDTFEAYLKVPGVNKALEAQDELGSPLMLALKNLRLLITTLSTARNADVDIDLEEMTSDIIGNIHRIRQLSNQLTPFIADNPLQIRLQVITSSTTTLVSNFLNQPQLNHDEIHSLIDSIQALLESFAENASDEVLQETLLITGNLLSLNVLLDSTYYGWSTDRTLSTLLEDETELATRIEKLGKDIDRLISRQDELIAQRTDAMVITLAGFRTGMTALTLGGILLTLTGLIILRRVLRARFDKLREATLEMRDGDLSARVDLHTKDDFGHLAESFNAMAGSLQSQKEQLDRANQDLESKIIERTQKLTQTVGRLKGEIQARREAEEDLEQIAFYDAVTGLPNRTLFRERLTVEINDCSRKQEQLTVCYIDLDKFKDVNDSLGHSAGDLLLLQVAKRIESITKRRTDLVARMGGDEFAVVFSGGSEDNACTSIVNDLIEQLSNPFNINGSTVHIGASIGIAVYPDNGNNYETLIRNADLAMYRAKERGRGTYQFFENALNERFIKRLALEKALRTAIEDYEFEVFYQPKIDMLNQRIVGAEALVRWRREGRGLISPAEFIPLAEETGLIIPIGWQVLNMALDKHVQFKERLAMEIPIAINISARQFHEETLAHKIAQSIRKRQINPSAVEIEITESAVMDNVAHAQLMLASLKELGVQISMDDFGTGYSSLAYLKRFPIDTIKIDRAFIMDLDQDKDDRSIVESIITLSNSLGTNLIAEGVEKQEHVDILLQMGCTTCQGFFYSPPVPADKFEKLLTTLNLAQTA